MEFISVLICAYGRILLSNPSFFCPTVLQPSYNIFGLEKLLAEKRIMTSLSNEAQYMNCCQHNRPLYVMMSYGLEERHTLYKVGLFYLSHYSVIMFSDVINKKCFLI
jgi:hypothetical protein